MHQARQSLQLAWRVTLTPTTLARRCLPVMAGLSHHRVGASFRVSVGRILHVQLDMRLVKISVLHTALERPAICKTIQRVQMTTRSTHMTWPRAAKMPPVPHSRPRSPPLRLASWPPMCQQRLSLELATAALADGDIDGSEKLIAQLDELLGVTGSEQSMMTPVLPWSRSPA